MVASEAGGRGMDWQGNGMTKLSLVMVMLHTLRRGLSIDDAFNNTEDLYISLCINITLKEKKGTINKNVEGHLGGLVS